MELPVGVVVLIIVGGVLLLLLSVTCCVVRCFNRRIHEDQNGI